MDHTITVKDADRAAKVSVASCAERRVTAKNEGTVSETRNLLKQKYAGDVSFNFKLNVTQFVRIECTHLCCVQPKTTFSVIQ